MAQQGEIERVTKEQDEVDMLPAEALTLEQLRERIRRVGIRPSTLSSNRTRVAYPQRPKWLAFVIRTFRLRWLY